jgi:hypothetical protein
MALDGLPDALVLGMRPTGRVEIGEPWGTNPYLWRLLGARLIGASVFWSRAAACSTRMRIASHGASLKEPITRKRLLSRIPLSSLSGSASLAPWMKESVTGCFRKSTAQIAPLHRPP